MVSYMYDEKAKENSFEFKFCFSPIFRVTFFKIIRLPCNKSLSENMQIWLLSFISPYMNSMPKLIPFASSELEAEESIINWSVEITDRLGSRLYSLWNRTAGDCLLDSVLQATWSVFDQDHTLRRALADSLNEGALT